MASSRNIEGRGTLVGGDGTHFGSVDYAVHISDRRGVIDCTGRMAGDAGVLAQASMSGTVRLRMEDGSEASIVMRQTDIVEGRALFQFTGRPPFV